MLVAFRAAPTYMVAVRQQEDLLWSFAIEMKNITV